MTERCDAWQDCHQVTIARFDDQSFRIFLMTH